MKLAEHFGSLHADLVLQSSEAGFDVGLNPGEIVALRCGGLLDQPVTIHWQPFRSTERALLVQTGNGACVAIRYCFHGSSSLPPRPLGSYPGGRSFSEGSFYRAACKGPATIRRARPQ